eukprot:TRINITY_DN19828_c0_g5_i2.p1 TRINITY_DN19828_c0_g5~~TRINITY_DN19828_c0_g5_i2.p1  ORF type:complete len:520 (-),score=122.23 TRINITY_DN19828_c0_g5_i2:63-1622(-)
MGTSPSRPYALQEDEVQPGSTTQEPFPWPFEGRAASSSSQEASCSHEEECAICLGEFSRAPVFQLANCGHRFHALCIASTLHVSMLCPLCRLEVSEDCALDVARFLLSESGSHGGQLLAAELLTDLKARGRTPDSELSAQETISALRRAAQKGETAKIPSIAALLGFGEGAVARSPQPAEVRLAAVEALRTLVPTFPSQWPGYRPVHELLRSTCARDNDEGVRLASMQALKEISQRGHEDSLMAARAALDDSSASDELRLQAAGLLQVVAVPGDACSINVALLALADRDYSVRSSAATTLRKICGLRGSCSESLGEIAALALNHEDGEVRCTALQLLGQAEQVGGLQGISAATTALQEDEDEEVRSAALQTLRCLWSVGDDQALKVLEGVVAKNGHASLRRAALEALPRVTRRGDISAAAIAAAALSDDDFSVSDAAAQALRQLSQRRDAAMEQLLLTYIELAEKPEVLRVVAELLGIVSTAGSEAEEALLRLLSSRGDADEDLKLVIENSLKRLSRSL